MTPPHQATPPTRKRKGDMKEFRRLNEKVRDLNILLERQENNPARFQETMAIYSKTIMERSDRLMFLLNSKTVLLYKRGCMRPIEVTIEKTLNVFRVVVRKVSDKSTFCTHVEMLFNPGYFELLRKGNVNVKSI